MPRLRGPPKPRSRLPRRFYTVDEYCDVKGESRAGAYKGMRTGRIPYVDEDGKRRIPVSYVDEQEKAAFAKINH